MEIQLRSLSAYRHGVERLMWTWPILARTSCATSPVATYSNVSWVIPNGAWSDHAGPNDLYGPSWVAAVVNAIGSNKRCAAGTKDGAGQAYWENSCSHRHYLGRLGRMVGQSAGSLRFKAGLHFDGLPGGLPVRVPRADDCGFGLYAGRVHQQSSARFWQYSAHDRRRESYSRGPVGLCG